MSRAALALLWVAAGCAAEGPGHESPSLPQGGAGAPPSPAAGAAGFGGSPDGDVHLVDARVPDAPTGQPTQVVAQDGGMTQLPEVDAEVPVDEDEPEPGTEQSESFCPAVPAALLEPGDAGDGSVSGCTPKVCAGQAPPTFDELYAMGGPEHPVSTPAGYAGCTRIDGDVVVSSYQGSDLRELSCLEHLNGSLLIWYSNALTSLDGLDALTFVAGDLRIGYAHLYLGENPALTRIDALAQLKAVGGSLVIHGSVLESLEGLSSVRAVGDDLRIALSTSLDDLRGLNSLEQIGGDLDLWRYEGPTSLVGLDALRSIGGSLYLINSDALRDSPGALPNVTCIGVDIDLSGTGDWGPNKVLEHASFLPALERVGHDVLVNVQPMLRTFMPLESVRYIGGTLHVSGNLLLTALPLTRLEHALGMHVHGNVALDTCTLIALGEQIGVDAIDVISNAGTCSLQR